MATEAVFIATDNLVEVVGLTNALTGGVLNSATVTLVQLEDTTGAVIAGSANINLAYVVASAGNYAGTLPYTVTLKKNATYVAVITADAGAGLFSTWRIPVVARYREA